MEESYLLKIRFSTVSFGKEKKWGTIAVLSLGGKHLLLERDVEQYLRGNYGAIREAKVEPNRLAPLPENISNSDLIKKKAG